MLQCLYCRPVNYIRHFISVCHCIYHKYGWLGQNSSSRYWQRRLLPFGYCSRSLWTDFQSYCVPVLTCMQGEASDFLKCSGPSSCVMTLWRSDTSIKEIFPLSCLWFVVWFLGFFCISALNKTKSVRCQYLMKKKELSVSVVKEQHFGRGKIWFHGVNATFYRFAGSGDSGSFAWRYLVFAWQKAWSVKSLCISLVAGDQNRKEIIWSTYNENDPRLPLFVRRIRGEDTVPELRLM